MAFDSGPPTQDDGWDEDGDDGDADEDADGDDDDDWDGSVACIEDDAGADGGTCPMFPCQNGYNIPNERVCDGFWDCEFGEDEDVVVCVSEPPDEVFACDDGSTVPDYFQCDGVPDCQTGEDEVGCPVYGDGGYICSNNWDLPDDWWCDSVPDCPEGEDEAQCDLDAGIEDGGVDAGTDGGVDAGDDVVLIPIDERAPAR